MNNVPDSARRPPRGEFLVGNHQSVAGIGDWVRVIGRAFGAEGLDLGVSSSVGPQGFNVILDEFSATPQIDALLRAQDDEKDAPKTILALSEFMGLDSGGGLRLNPFETWSAGVGLHGGRLDRTARGIGVAASRERYLRKRAAGLQDVLQRARIDLALCGHPEIVHGLAGACRRWNISCPPTLDVLHPTMSDGVWEAPSGTSRSVGLSSPAAQFTDDLAEGSRGGLACQYEHLMPVVGQGHDTPFRERVNRRLRLMGVPSVRIPELRIRPPDSPYWGLDLVAPRTPGWPYLSPFRLLRAHSLGLIPVMLTSWAPKDGSPWESFVLRVESLEEMAALRLRLNTEYLHELTVDKRAALAVDLVSAGAAWSEAMDKLGIRLPNQSGS